LGWGHTVPDTISFQTIHIPEEILGLASPDSGIPVGGWMWAEKLGEAVC